MSEQYDRDAILDRIAAALALSKDAGATAGEQAAAAAAAARLMRRYSIDEAEAAKRGEKVQSTLGMDEFTLTNDGPGTMMKFYLLNAIGKAVFVRVIRRGSTLRAWLIGSEAGREAAKRIYQHIYTEMLRLADRGWQQVARDERFAYGAVQSSAIKWKNSFCLGCEMTVRQRLEALRAEEEREEQAQGDTSRALVVVDMEQQLDRAVSDFIHGKITNQKAQHSIRSDAHRAGREAGHQIDLHLNQKIGGR